MSYRANRRRHRGRRNRRHVPPTGRPTPEQLWDAMRPVWPGGGPPKTEVQKLTERAHFALFQGRHDDAEKLFREILAKEPVAAVANNLALLELARHNRPADALRTLEKNLDEADSGAQPYAHALAARCLVRLDRKDEAREAVERAVVHFEAGLPHVTRPDSRRAWQEYTSCLLEAAGQLGDDEYVWELYQRWTRHHVRDTSHYYGGVAAFNLQRYRSARSAWGRIRDRGKGFMNPWDTVAWWCEIGVMEPFRLEYSAVGPQTKEQVEEHFRAVPRGPDGVRTEDVLQAVGELLDNPVNRLWFVWRAFRFLLFSPWSVDIPKPEDEPKRFQSALVSIQLLVAAGGEWGAALARRLLLDRHCPPPAKALVAMGLELADRIRKDEPMEVLWYGETREMTIDEMLADAERIAMERHAEAVEH